MRDTVVILIGLVVILSLVDGRSFTIDYKKDCYSKDGQCYRYISGEMHYFRIPPGMWEDRLAKLKAAGFNTVQTYVPWNVHEPEDGVYNFGGIADVFRYMSLAQRLQLNVILRPGPFLATEWDFGGLPPWLLRDRPGLHTRTNNTVFMKEVRGWYSKLLPALKPWLYSRGGPVIAVQVENEYGSNKPCDEAHFDYLRQLLKIYKEELGEEVVLFTVDGDSRRLAKCGNIPGLYSTVNFGPGGSVSDNFAVQRKQEPRGPYVCSAFFSGWLDHWGSKFNKVSAEEVASAFGRVLAFANSSASVSMYMFHGGTNFGYMQGSRGERPVLGVIGKMTSYDYDAPLSEAGDTTWKYHLIRNVTRHYSPIYDVPSNTTKQHFGKIQMYRASGNLISSVRSDPVYSRYPISMEEMGQNHGFVLYNTTLSADTVLPAELRMGLFGDRVYLLDDDLAVVDMTSRNRPEKTFKVTSRNVYLLVDDNGHVNTGHIRYNSTDYYKKGLVSNVTVNGHIQENWRAVSLEISNAPFETASDVVQRVRDGEMPKPTRNVVQVAVDDNLIEHPDESIKGFVPYFYYGFVQDITGDFFVDMSGWGKGVLFVGDYNLGRYWPLAGPQVRHFCPKEWTAQSSDTTVITIFELEQASRDLTVSLVDIPLVDGPYDPTQL